MSRAHDVAVVGAGPVGLLVACLLAGAGVDVTVCERRVAPAGVPRAIGIHAPGLEALDLARVGAAVHAEAAAIRRGVARRGGRELGRLRFDRPVLSLPQDRTEALLEARLASVAPGSLRRGLRVSAVHQGAVTVSADVEGGETVTARYLVAADGVRSTVRGLLGVGTRRRRGTADYVMADARAGGEARDDEAVLHLEPGGVVESFPLPGGLRRWVIRADRRAAPADPAGFAGLLRERVGVRIAPSDLTPPSRFTARQGVSVRLARGRVALVGDAAHEISPIGGQGMNLGWAGAVELAATLLDALERGAPPAPFGDYERRRTAAAGRAMRRAAFNMAMGAPVGGLRAAGRDALVRALALPPARAALARAFTMHGL